MHSKKSFFEKFGFGIESRGVTIDLVCGMEFKNDLPEYSVLYKGRRYYFCSENCRSHFDAEPEKYAE